MHVSGGYTIGIVMSRANLRQETSCGVCVWINREQLYSQDVREICRIPGKLRCHLLPKFPVVSHFLSQLPCDSVSVASRSSDRLQFLWDNWFVFESSDRNSQKWMHTFGPTRMFMHWNWELREEKSSGQSGCITSDNFFSLTFKNSIE